ncbi:MAG: RNA polymerase sigma factor [Gemmatimonadaceae bacterium]
MDDQLVVLADRAADDVGAFERLAVAVRGTVLRWARAATGDADEAEDVAQLVLLQLQRSIGGVAVRERFRSWLFRVTRNVVLDRRRRERRRQLLLEAADHEEGIGQSVSEGDPQPPSLEPMVRAFLDTLTPRQQQIFELVDLQRLSAVDAAVRLGIAASTARVLLMQARRTMRLKMLEQHPHLLEEYGRDL